MKNGFHPVINSFSPDFQVASMKKDVLMTHRSCYPSGSLSVVCKAESGTEPRILHMKMYGSTLLCIAFFHHGK